MEKRPIIDQLKRKDTYMDKYENSFENFVLYIKPNFITVMSCYARNVHIWCGFSVVMMIL